MSLEPWSGHIERVKVRMRQSIILFNPITAKCQSFTPLPNTASWNELRSVEWTDRNDEPSTHAVGT